jgi:hypothetical protein
VLIVDDDHQVHEVIPHAVRYFQREGRRFEFHGVLNIEQARSYLLTGMIAEFILVNCPVISRDFRELKKFIESLKESGGMRLLSTTGGRDDAAEEVHAHDLCSDNHEKISDPAQVALCAAFSTYRTMVKKAANATTGIAYQGLHRNGITQGGGNQGWTSDAILPFLAHELKGPIANFKTLVDILVDHPDLLDKNTAGELLVSVQQSAGSIHEMLDNTLNWIRFQKHEFEYNPSQVDLDQVIQETLSIYQGNARSKNIATSYSTTVKPVVQADSYMISSVLRNLLSNAVKFTPAGGKVHISMNIAGDVVNISVEDTGMGISEEIQKKLFNPDIHCTTKGTSQEIGSGYGLILVREFIIRHGGDISFVSEKGKGSVFTISLPLAEK